VGGHHPGLYGHGKPQIGNRADGFPEETWRHDADDAACDSVDFEHLSEGRGAARELAVPEGVAEDDDGRRGWPIVVFGEDPAGVGVDAENAEVVAGDDGAFDGAEGSTAAEDGLAEWEIADGEQAVEYLLRGGQLAVQGIAHVDRQIVLQQLNLDQRGGG